MLFHGSIPCCFWRDRLSHGGRGLKCYLTEIIPTYVIAQITGYSKGYVDKWCCDEVIESMTVANRRYVRKDLLLDYLASDKYSGITKRSKKHKESVDRFLTKYLKAHRP